jgi:hypothetical protein
MTQSVRINRPYPFFIREKAQPWDHILAAYDSRVSFNSPLWLPFRDLAKAITAAPYSSLLHGVTGMDTLSLYGYCPFAYGHEMLTLKWDLWDHSLVFTYHEHSFMKAWQKRCSTAPHLSDETLRVFEHIITDRLIWIVPTSRANT